ncbi:hypothetical protein [Faecalibacterium prausnitzii]|uniref:hypothetical protein n=1 Tax=Faecalibacterium prausnitzii TaxID=853 RepID=UPI003A804A33
MKISDAEVDGNIYAASSASWYQLAIFESDFSKSKFKMLVGLCPNPICSASRDAGCAFVPNAFITKRRDKTRVLLKGRALVCRCLMGLCFFSAAFLSAQTDRIAGQGSRYFAIKATKRNAGKGTIFSSADSILNATIFIRSIIKVTATGKQGYQPLCKTAALRLR